MKNRAFVQNVRADGLKLNWLWHHYLFTRSTWKKTFQDRIVASHLLCGIQSAEKLLSPSFESKGDFTNTCISASNEITLWLVSSLLQNADECERRDVKIGGILDTVVKYIYSIQQMTGFSLTKCHVIKYVPNLHALKGTNVFLFKKNFFLMNQHFFNII